MSGPSTAELRHGLTHAAGGFGQSLTGADRIAHYVSAHWRILASVAEAHGMAREVLLQRILD